VYISKRFVSDQSKALMCIIDYLKRACHTPGCNDIGCPALCPCNRNTKYTRLNDQTALVWKFANILQTFRHNLIRMKGRKITQKQYENIFEYPYNQLDVLLDVYSVHHFNTSLCDKLFFVAHNLHKNLLPCLNEYFAFSYRIRKLNK